MKKTFLVFVLFLCGVCRLGADTVPFTLHDLDGNSYDGRLLELTPEKIVLQTEDEGPKEFSTKEVVKLESQRNNPFVSKEKTPERSTQPILTDRWGRPNRFPVPSINRSSRTGQAIASHLEKKEAETNADGAKNEFPNTLTVIDGIDGSRLLASEFLVKGKIATLRLFPYGELTLPLDRLVAARLSVGDPTQVIDPPSDWTKFLVQPSTKGDRMVVGTVGSLDVHEGIINEISSETIRFTVDGDALPVPRRKVFGVVFHQPGPPKPSHPFARLTCWNGTFLVLGSLELRADGYLAWKTVAGAEGSFQPDEIAEILFETLNAVSLSELTSNIVEQSLPFAWEKGENSDTSPLSLFQRFQSNRLRQGTETLPPAESILQQILQRRLPGEARSTKVVEWPIPDFKGIELDGTVYRQGFVVPAKTTLDFPLKDSYKTFAARIGIDDRIRPDGDVRLTILGDDLLLLDLVVRGNEPSKPLKFDIENCKKLTVSVDFVDGVSGAAVLSLVDLKLIKE